ncbi:MAG TPA: HIT domain-containing protein [Candidatus Onthovivens sp.]|nr:HIT domain-containing protein [Candidatus Onthovivens sp.]
MKKTYTKNFDENCLFCKIANHVIPSSILFEDDDVLAFLDINPVTYGHALVISKAHYETFLSCPRDILEKVMNVSQRIGQIAIKILGAKGVNILTNCYPASGQEIPHFHVHVIPRYEANDKFKIEMKDHLKGLNLPQIAEEIRKDLQ